MNAAPKVQAKAIGDDELIEAVYAVCVRKGSWANRWEVGRELGDRFPEKVVLAKLRRLIRRGALDGCACGCRGDLEATGRPYERRSCTLAELLEEARGMG